MEKRSKRKFTYFLGVDVSRNKLDFALLQDKQQIFHKEIENEKATIFSFLKSLKELKKFTFSKCLVSMEDTGFYCNHLTECLKKLKMPFIKENPLKIKRTLGISRGKTDKADALRIAQYGQKHQDEIYFREDRRPVINKIASLCSLRNRLGILQGAIKMPLNEQRRFVRKSASAQQDKLCKGTLNAIDKDLQVIEKELDNTIKADHEFHRLMKIIQSVPQIGRVTAMHIIISTNEFRDIKTAKKFACYAGVAPFPNESGTIRHKAKISHVANKKMKALLHVCALGAIRNIPELREYYRRKTIDEGKPKMSVINAVRFKLILRVFTCVSQNREYQAEYRSSSFALTP
jgi:transposase